MYKPLALYMGQNFRSISHGFLAIQIAGGDADNTPVAGRVIFQHRLHGLPDIRCAHLGQKQLLAGQAPGGVHLPGKGGVKGPCPQDGDQRLRVNVHLGKLGIGEQPRVAVEDRAVAITAALLNHRYVIEMPGW